MTPPIETLGDALPKEIARVQEVLAQYVAIGPAGQFGAHFIRQDLAAASKAMIEGDVVAMIKAYQKLREIEP